MTAIDRAALIEQAARAEWAACWNIPWEPDGGGEWRRITAAALPVIAKALLAPLRELHQPKSTRERLPNGVTVPWSACTCGFRTHSACPTVRLLDAIEAEVQP